MRVLFVLVAVITVAGCAVQQHPLTATAAAGLKGRRVALTARPPTLFYVYGTGKETLHPGGLVGLVSRALETGEQILRENGIADPAPYLAQRLGDDLRRRYGLTLEQQAQYVTNDDPTQMTAAYPAADLLLDVWLNDLSLGRSTQDSSKRQVNYAAEIRLIDAKVVHLIDGKKGRVIAHGRCTRTSAKTPNPPSYDDLLANGAQRLKDELADAARFCVDEFRSKVLTAGHAP